MISVTCRIQRGTITSCVDFNSLDHIARIYKTKWEPKSISHFYFYRVDPKALSVARAPFYIYSPS